MSAERGAETNLELGSRASTGPRRAAPRLGGRWSRTAIVLMLLAVVGLGVGWKAKAPCIDTYTFSTGQRVLDWRDYRQYDLHCYSDTIPLYGIDHLEDGGLPYKTSWTESDGQQHYMEYPVLTGMLQYAVAIVTKDYVKATQDPASLTDEPDVVIYFTLMAIVLAVAWLIAVGCTIPLTARPRDAVLMALSPLIAIHAFTNFDTLAVAFASAGMYAWARKRPGWAGILLGLGAAAKLYPLFILGPLLVLCLRTGKMRPWYRAAAGGAVAWLAVNLPIAVLYPHGWWEFFRLNSSRPADHDSIYNAISVFTGWAGFDGTLYQGQTPHILNDVTFGLFALVCLGVAAIGLTAPRRPRVASLVFLIVAGFLLTNKVWSPQYSLWLVPLAVLALPRWLPLLAWMGVDAYLWYPRLGYFLGLAEPGQGNSPKAFLSVVLIRDLLVVIICALIVRTIYRPDTDPVRRTGWDDPAGGPLDDAADLAGSWRGRLWPRGQPTLEAGPNAEMGPVAAGGPADAGGSVGGGGPEVGVVRN
jgi:uncharacterized membrane protein